MDSAKQMFQWLGIALTGGGLIGWLFETQSDFTNGLALGLGVCCLIAWMVAADQENAQ